MDCRTCNAAGNDNQEIFAKFKYFSQISQYWPGFRGGVGYLKRNKQIQNVDFPLSSLAFCLPA